MTEVSEELQRTAHRAVQGNTAGREEKAALFGIKALWLHFATECEIRRLAKLHLRIQRKQDGLHQLINERQKIMNRSIRRMRRANGKN
ncbi:hypothetical protein [Pseudophaeobacter sp. C1-32P7]|uniref:hypothetical protein n=1 Tax=Pseudophaeobacter sp. C1-32P7 TaxID=3098142 RepID=UPI0034D6074F